MIRHVRPPDRRAKTVYELSSNHSFLQNWHNYPETLRNYTIDAFLICIKKICCCLEILVERFLRQHLLCPEYVIHSHEVEVEKVRFWQSHYSVKEENEIDPLLSYNVIVSDEEKRVPTKKTEKDDQRDEYVTGCLTQVILGKPNNLITHFSSKPIMWTISIKVIKWNSALVTQISTHSLHSKILPFRSKTITRSGN
jgi:hypothetical protein